MSPLNCDLEEKFRCTLMNAAKELTIGECLPVDIERVGNKLQVEFRRDTRVIDHRKAQLTGKSQISLPPLLLPLSGYFSPMERYKVAHEMGHHVLARLCSATPLGKSEYWQFEDLCNVFARLLLIPETAIASFSKPISSPEDALVLSSELANKALVPWPTAAWRVAEHDTRFALFEVKAGKDRLGQHVMKIAASTLPRKQLQRKYLNAEVGLGRILKTLTPWQESVTFCVDDIERAEIMAELPALGEVERAYAKRVTSRAIRVAISLKQ